MNTNQEPKRSRTQIVTAAVIGGGVVAALAVAAFAVPNLRSTAGDEAAPSSSPSASASAAAAPTPQPTASAAIDESQEVKRDYTVEVVKTESVKGVADGPGEIAGPAVRFSIVIHNDTAKAIDLSNTVVNAYFGTAQTPALQLLNPGGRALPSSVAAGRTASGVFIFTVPKSQRANVKVTVDTAVNNPVVAFTGAVPR